MKSMKKLAALLLVLVMTLTLAACGGGKGRSKTNPVVGKYIGETVLSFDEWVPMDEVYDLGDNYIELKEDGTGCFMLDGDPTTIAWKLDKDGALTLDRDGSICNCTLEDGLITVNEVGVSIWNMLQKEVTFDKLVQGILDEYDVEEQVAREDIREFLDKLIAGGILKADHEDRDNEQDT